VVAIIIVCSQAEHLGSNDISDGELAKLAFVNSARATSPLGIESPKISEETWKALE